jgi:hypothetical protein
MTKLNALSVMSALWLLGLTGGQAAAQHAEEHLKAAGFVRYAADTPAKLAQLHALAPNRFITRKTKDGTPYYIYANPENCICALVGNQQAMDSYSRRWSELTPEQLGAGMAGSGGGPSLKRGIVYDMQDDDVENRFARDILGRDFVPGYVPGLGN